MSLTAAQGIKKARLPHMWNAGQLCPSQNSHQIFIDLMVRVYSAFFVLSSIFFQPEDLGVFGKCAFHCLNAAVLKHFPCFLLGNFKIQRLHKSLDFVGKPRIQAQFAYTDPQ